MQHQMVQKDADDMGDDTTQMQVATSDKLQYDKPAELMATLQVTTALEFGGEARSLVQHLLSLRTTDTQSSRHVFVAVECSLARVIFGLRACSLLMFLEQ